MDKKIIEMADSMKKETVSDLLSLFNVNNEQKNPSSEKWDYTIIEEKFIQSLPITTPSTPIIVHNGDKTYFSFDGRTLFLEKNLKKFYVFLPFAIKDACVFEIKNKAAAGNTKVLITLDTQNKLTYSSIEAEGMSDCKIIISRNVLQILKAEKEVYYLSFKKDNYFINIVSEDSDGILKPKVYIHNLTSKYNISIFSALKSVFIYQDGYILSNLDKKSKIKGDGIYGLQDMYVISNKIEDSIRLTLYDSNFILRNEMVIANKSHVVKFISLKDILSCRIGYKIYFVGIVCQMLQVLHELDVPKNTLDFSMRLEVAKQINVYFLVRKNEEKLDNTKQLSIDHTLSNNQHLLPITTSVEKSSAILANQLNLKNTKNSEVNKIKLDSNSLFLSNDHITDKQKKQINEDVNDFILPKPSIDSKIYNPDIENSTIFSDCNDVIKFNKALCNDLSSFVNSSNNKIKNIVYSSQNSNNINSTELLDQDLCKPNKILNTSSIGQDCVSKMTFSNDSTINIDKIVEQLYHRFEQKIEERDKILKNNQYELLDKLSESFNNSLIGSIQKIVRSEISVVEKNLTGLFDEKLKNIARNTSDEVKIFEFIKNIICDNLLPVIESSMDEIRIQVVAEMSTLKDSEYMQKIQKALSRLEVGQKSSEIEKILSLKGIDAAIQYVINGTNDDMKEFIRILDPELLEFVTSKYIVLFLEKYNLLQDKYKKNNFDDVVYNSLIFIDLEVLEEDELKRLDNILSRIKDNSLYNEDHNKQILVLANFLHFKIQKAILKRQKNKTLL